jgi:hypothetical protein
MFQANLPFRSATLHCKRGCGYATEHGRTFNDRRCEDYEVPNTAPPGVWPVEGITLNQTLRYKERTVGLQRFWAAHQASVTVNYVLRCPCLRDVSAQDVAIPNDGKQYRIVQIQYPEDVDPPVMDLTLDARGDQAGIRHIPSQKARNWMKTAGRR